QDNSFGLHQLFYRDGVYTEFQPDLPEVQFPIAVAINDRDQVIGDGYTLEPGHPFVSYLYDHGITTKITVPGATNTFVNDINNNGDIIGTFDYGPEQGVTHSHGFLYSHGAYTAIDGPPTARVFDSANGLDQLGGAFAKSWWWP